VRIESKRIEREFQMTTDPLGEAYVTIRQVKFGEAVRRAEMQARRRQIIRNEDQGEMVIEQDWNHLKVMANEIILTLTGARGFATDDKGTELLRFKEKDGLSRLDMEDNDFYKALGSLDEKVVEEIHGFVKEMNPQWDPSAKGE